MVSMVCYGGGNLILRSPIWQWKTQQEHHNVMQRTCVQVIPRQIQGLVYNPRGWRTCKGGWGWEGLVGDRVSVCSGTPGVHSVHSWARGVRGLGRGGAWGGWGGMVRLLQTISWELITGPHGVTYND